MSSNQAQIQSVTQESSDEFPNPPLSDEFPGPTGSDEFPDPPFIAGPLPGHRIRGNNVSEHQHLAMVGKISYFH